MLENFANKVTDEPQGHLGIYAVYSRNDDRMMIVHVTPGSPADEAGIKAGDSLLGVADTRLSKATFRYVDSLITGPVGTQVRVQTSRGGLLQTNNLERKEMVNVIE